MSCQRIIMPMENAAQTTPLRERAIEKARARVYRDGFANLKLSDVARDLGVTHAALYKYFANKQDLIDAINVQWMNEINAKLLAISNQTGSPEARIRQWFLALYQMRREKSLNNAGEYESYIRTEELHRPCAQQDALERRKQLADLSKQAMDAGEFAYDRPEHIVELLFNACDHFVHPAFIANHANQDKSENFKQILEILTRGLRPQQD